MKTVLSRVFRKVSPGLGYGVSLMAQGHLAIQATRGRHRHAFTDLAVARGVIFGRRLSLLVILMIQIFLVCVHRNKLKEIVSDGALVARLTPGSRAFFFAPKHDRHSHKNRQIRVPIRTITVRGIDPTTTAIDPVIDPISTTG